MPPMKSRIEGGLRCRRQAPPQGSPARPLITIITVVRNGERHIEQTILSVLNQPYDNIEYILIDGGSTDGTLDIIRKYEDRIAYWTSEPDHGIYDAMNKGIKASSGILINLLNADDYLEPNAVQSIADEFLDINRTCIIYSDVYYIDERYSVKARFYCTITPWVGMTMNHQSMFVHREVYNKIGLYDTQYKLSSDYDFFVRCSMGKIDFMKVDAAVVNCRNAGATYIYSGKSRKEANIINRIYYSSLLFKRMAFILFNYGWMPVKMNLRSCLYKSIGVHATRKLISAYKRFKHLFQI
jgi:glycosyltransferase involved in cell wall biosynthesis